MNETYLNMTGAEVVVEAVQHCWASLFGARTVSVNLDAVDRARRLIASAELGVLLKHAINPEAT